MALSIIRKAELVEAVQRLLKMCIRIAVGGWRRILPANGLLRAVRAKATVNGKQIQLTKLS